MRKKKYLQRSSMVRLFLKEVFRGRESLVTRRDRRNLLSVSTGFGKTRAPQVFDTDREKNELPKSVRKNTHTYTHTNTHTRRICRCSLRARNVQSAVWSATLLFPGGGKRGRGKADRSRRRRRRRRHAPGSENHANVPLSLPRRALPVRARNLPLPPTPPPPPPLTELLQPVIIILTWKKKKKIKKFS